MTPKELRQLADHLFEKKLPLMTLLQEIAENFYPERADFTVTRYLGTNYAGNLMTSYPPMCRRDLGDSIGTMLRDLRKPWFEMTTQQPLKDDGDAKAWLQWATGLQRRVMYDPDAFFQKGAKLGDHDFAAFGMDVAQVTPNTEYHGVQYRWHHLRDVAWMEDDSGKIVFIARRFKPTVRDLNRKFKANKMRPGNKVAPEVIKLLDKKPFQEVNCLHMMVVSDMWTGDSGRGDAKKPWVSIYFDCDHNFEMQAIAQWNKEYVISRWQTFGTQYAMSPAVVVALPEARLLQSMTFTLLEAGEKIVNPSMMAVEQAVRSDVDLSSGGITWIEYEYDHKTGEPLKPLQTDAKGLPIGREMQGDSRQMLAQCFYLNKLKPFVPTTDPTMTAFQAGQIVAQYIRDALPLFAPMEDEKNGGICLETFECIKRMNGFGPPQLMPKSLRNQDVRFRFQSPLHDMIDSQKGQKFLEMGQLVAQAMALDKTVATVPNAVVALRDALDGIQVPAKWTRSEAEAGKLQQDMAAKDQAAQSLAAMGQGAEVAATLAGAMKDGSAAQPAAA